jgi:hypothetical protein
VELTLNPAEAVTERVLEGFPGASRELVGAFVRAAFDRYWTAPVKVFLPVLIQREVQEWLRRLARVFGPDLIAQETLNEPTVRVAQGTVLSAATLDR